MTSKKLMKEQENQLIEDELLRQAMETSKKEVYSDAPKNERPAGKPSGNQQESSTKMAEHIFNLTLQLNQLGFSTQQAVQAIKRCPKGASLETVLNNLYGK